MVEVKVTEYKGYPIYYDDHKRLFSAFEYEDKERTLRHELGMSHESQEGLEKMIDGYVKRKHLFPIEVILGHGRVVYLGKITSVVQERASPYGGSTLRVWFTYDDRRKEKQYFGNYYRRTPKNLEIVKEIERLRQEAQSVEKRIDDLAKTFEQKIEEKDLL